MMKMNLQFFAHKKGVGSTKNGRDSESKRLGAKRADGQFVKAGNILYDSAVRGSIPVLTWDSAGTILFRTGRGLSSNMKEKAATKSRFLCILSNRRCNSY